MKIATPASSARSSMSNRSWWCGWTMPRASLRAPIRMKQPGARWRNAEKSSPPIVGRALDDYIEAQVHGPIDLARDVEALVIDPSFDGTPTGDVLASLAARYGIAMRRHPGFVLTATDVDDDFRGPRMRPLARRIAGEGAFDAARIGEAARSLAEDPASCADWDDPAEAWQHLKQLWHCLVRFGR